MMQNNPPASDDPQLLNVRKADGDTKSRVLLISHDVIGKAMAGPGIRNYNLARVLGKETDLILAAVQPDETEVTIDPATLGVQKVISYRHGNWADLAEAAAWAEVIICSSDGPNEFTELRNIDAALVIDGYDPLLPEYLALNTHFPIDKQVFYGRERIRHLHYQYLAGDFFICASERQRNWWLGQLQVAGRINALTFNADITLRSLVDLVPFGLPETPPQHTKQMVKGVWPGISTDDKLLLWGGGLWAWLDSITAIRAVAKVRQTRPEVKLIFPGTKHPNPVLDGIQTQNQLAYDTATELGLLDTGVFFGDWVERAEWPSLLLECDIALSLHYDSVETQLAFRSRVIDYIWAGLPMVATTGDATSELVQQHDLGLVVDYEDVDAVAAAIIQLLDEPAGCRQKQFNEASTKLTWACAAQPLIKFCQNPHHAPDRELARENHPYYQESEHESEQAALHDLRLCHQKDIEHLQAMVQGYENGKFISFMRTVKQFRTRLIKWM